MELHRTRIKMCGITRIEDVQSVCAAGTDAIGFVFYPPSPRAISIDVAAELSRNVSMFVDKTVLFVNADAGYIREVVDAVGADVIQFHGDESEAFCQQFGKRYIKALRVGDVVRLQNQLDEHAQASAILLDAYVAGVPGGTGQSFDWRVIPADLKSRLILAGGLEPDNIVDAITSVRPYAVDVSGGIELGKGIKSASKIKAFAERVRKADQAVSEITS